MTAHFIPARLPSISTKRMEKKRADKLAELRNDVLAARPDKQERHRQASTAFKAQGENA